MHIKFFLAALRELFRAKHGNHAGSDFSSGELIREVRLVQSREKAKAELQSEGENFKCKNPAEEPQRSPAKFLNAGGSFLQLNDAADEFFDVLDESEYEQSETIWPSNSGMQSQVSDCFQFCLKFF